MVHLKVDYKNSIIGDKILNYYNIFEERIFNPNITIYNGFETFIDKVYKKKNQNYNIKDRINLIEDPINLNSSDNILIGYSSGLNSTYQALKFHKLKYKINLFHIKDFNKPYPDEYFKAIEFNKNFNFNLIIINVKHINKEYWSNNPIKSQLILAYMFDYAIENNINNLAMGNNDLFDDFNSGMKNYINNFNYFPIIGKEREIYSFLVDNYPNSFSLINSCVLHPRFKRRLNKMNNNKYNISLYENRCGSCYKCAIEYIMLANLGFYELNKEYQNHCCDTLRNHYYKLTDKFFNISNTNEEIINKVLEK